MRILYTEVDTSYACKELGNALMKAIPYIDMVAGEYRVRREDNRTLVIVETCPCCHGDSRMDIEGAILVSPFKGIDRRGYNIHRIDMYPPFRTPGHDGEANNMEEFLEEWRKTINKALV